MIAKVMHNNSVYYSPVFAVSIKRNNCNAVVFDNSFSKLIVKTIFKDTHYNILFMDHNTDNFSINEDKLKSYWNDKSIFKTIKHKKYTPEMLQEAQEILTKMRPKEYTTITAQSDLEALDFNTGSFHDGYILAMQEKNDTLEILFDTSWGSLAILRCKGVIENKLEIGYTFCHCYMNIDNDGVVSFLISSMGHNKESVLKAKEIQFKPLFEKRIPLRKFDYTINNNELIIKCDDQEIKINKVNNDILDFAERNVLGYLENNESMQKCFIFNKDIVYGFHQYISPNKKPDPNVAIFKEKCEQEGFAFDNYPLFDYYEECEQDYGELVYSYQYKKLHQFIEIFKILIPTLFVYNMLILVIQLVNPQMKWGFYLIFGLGISLFVALVSLITVLKNDEQKYIEIYENGIKYLGYNTRFNCDYSDITKAEYKNKIILHMSMGKFTLSKTENDKHIFELISERVFQKNHETNQ